MDDKQVDEITGKNVTPDKAASPLVNGSDGDTVTGDCHKIIETTETAGDVACDPDPESSQPEENSEDVIDKVSDQSQTELVTDDNPDVVDQQDTDAHSNDGTFTANQEIATLEDRNGTSADVQDSTEANKDGVSVEESNGVRAEDNATLVSPADQETVEPKHSEDVQEYKQRELGDTGENEEKEQEITDEKVVEPEAEVNDEKPEEDEKHTLETEEKEFKPPENPSSTDGASRESTPHPENDQVAAEADKPKGNPDISNKEVEETKRCEESSENKKEAEETKPCEESSENKKEAEMTKPCEESSEKKEEAEMTKPCEESSENKKEAEMTKPCEGSSDNKKEVEMTKPCEESSENKKEAEMTKPCEGSSEKKEEAGVRSNAFQEKSESKASPEESKPVEKEVSAKQTEPISGSSSSTSSSSRSSVLTKPPRPRCPKCNRSVRDKAALENHVCEKEAEDEVKVKVTISSNKEKETFTCIDCGFTGGERPFSEHLVCHLMLRPYQCLHCKECFINRKETSIHVHKAHNGAKLSCALSTPKALRKAKALIKEANNCGIISFMARVGAKVPLERDPERPAIKPIPAKDIIERSKEADSASKVETSSDKSNQDGENNTPDKEVESDNTIPKENCPDEAPVIKTVSEGLTPGFSKLREVLTGSSSLLPGCLSEKTESERVPRIVDSYSLKDTSAKEVEDQSGGTLPGQSEPMEEGEAVPIPSLMPAPSVTPGDNQSEILSFLGPEQPIYRAAMDETLASLLAPPPLIPAPSTSDDPNFPPPPQLSSISSAHPSSRQAGSSQALKKNPNFFVCGFNCLFSSLSADEFQEHTTNFHSNEAFFPCYHCGHSSTNEADLVAHVMSHSQVQDKSSPLYVCGNDGGCQFGSNMVADYINHMRMTHPQILEPMCYACGDTFDDLPSLQQHAEQNVLHVVNCPHCPSKATERRAILNHISSAHPGKPKMVSVAKQLICYERKLNNYAAMKSFREMQPPTLTPAPSLTSATLGSASGSSNSVVDQILSRHEQSGRGRTLSDILTGRISSGRSSTADPSNGGRASPDHSADMGSVVVKNEVGALAISSFCTPVHHVCFRTAFAN